MGRAFEGVTQVSERVKTRNLTRKENPAGRNNLLSKCARGNTCMSQRYNQLPPKAPRSYATELHTYKVALSLIIENTPVQDSYLE